ncbi:MAG TPA: hypothetical protein VMG08_02210 [Allosphingosinicella sp.]|nr:hypothetical protein [Allosphingosinicella sp.]
MSRRVALAALTLAALPLASASAVGLGPLTKAGLTDGPRKAFYLTLTNPYASATAFRAYAIGMADETPQPRVRILPGDEVRLGGNSNRQLLVVAGGMAPGETYAFRVCAERAQPVEGMIRARVCSKLTARRLAAR